MAGSLGTDMTSDWSSSFDLVESDEAGEGGNSGTFMASKFEFAAHKALTALISASIYLKVLVLRDVQYVRFLLSAFLLTLSERSVFLRTQQWRVYCLARQWSGMYPANIVLSDYVV